MSVVLEERNIDRLARIAVDVSVHIHKELGPGLLESVYEAVLANRLAARGINVERQVPVRFTFDGITFNEGLRIDLLLDKELIIELKSVESFAPVHAKQLLTYLRLMELPLGLLLNFGAPVMKDGIKRIVNNY